MQNETNHTIQLFVSVYPSSGRLEVKDYTVNEENE